MNGDEVDLLPARMVKEFAYCPRLFYLQFVRAVGARSEAAARWTGSRGVDVTPRGDMARKSSLPHQPG